MEYPMRTANRHSVAIAPLGCCRRRAADAVFVFPEGTLAWVAKQAEPTPLLWRGNKVAERQARSMTRTASSVQDKVQGGSTEGPMLLGSRREPQRQASNMGCKEQAKPTPQHDLVQKPSRAGAAYEQAETQRRSNRPRSTAQAA